MSFRIFLSSVVSYVLIWLVLSYGLWQCRHGIIASLEGILGASLRDAYHCCVQPIHLHWSRCRLYMAYGCLFFTSYMNGVRKGDTVATISIEVGTVHATRRLVTHLSYNERCKSRDLCHKVVFFGGWVIEMHPREVCIILW